MDDARWPCQREANQSPAAAHARGDASSRTATRRLSAHILATTPEGTRSALDSVTRLTDGMAARIILLVPRLASRRPEFDPSSEERLVRRLARDGYAAVFTPGSVAAPDWPIRHDGIRDGPDAGGRRPGEAAGWLPRWWIAGMSRT
jgi:hypothetical protein